MGNFSLSELKRPIHMRRIFYPKYFCDKKNLVSKLIWGIGKKPQLVQDFCFLHHMINQAHTCVPWKQMTTQDLCLSKNSWNPMSEIYCMCRLRTAGRKVVHPLEKLAPTVAFNLGWKPPRSPWSFKDNIETGLTLTLASFLSTCGCLPSGSRDLCMPYLLHKK